MRPAENIEKLVKKLCYQPSARTQQRMLGNILKALDKKKKPADPKEKDTAQVVEAEAAKEAEAPEETKPAKEVEVHEKAEVAKEAEVSKEAEAAKEAGATEETKPAPKSSTPAD